MRMHVGYHIHTTQDLTKYIHDGDFDKLKKRMKEIKGTLSASDDITVYITCEEAEKIAFSPEEISKYKKEPWDS